MNCATYIRANDLNYCTDSGTLNIGQLATNYDFNGDEVAVMVKDLATGRTVIAAATPADLPDVTIALDWLPTPGQMYQITVVGPTVDSGIQPLKFRPYNYDTATQGYALEANADAVDGVWLRFVKLFTGADAVAKHAEQWVSIA